MIATRWPSAASRRAVARPIPRAPPVTSATRLIARPPASVPDHRMIALAQLIPAPNPTSNTKSPSCTRPRSMASTSAKGIEAAEVFPVLCSTVAVRSIGMASRWHADSMMRMLAWWGTTRSISDALRPAFASERCATTPPWPERPGGRLPGPPSGRSRRARRRAGPRPSRPIRGPSREGRRCRCRRARAPTRRRRRRRGSPCCDRPGP